MTFLRKPLVTFGLSVACAGLLTPALLGTCKCHHPEKDDATRWGGNEAIVIVPEKHFREVNGTVAFRDDPMEDALVEVFDEADYLVSDKPWVDRPKQNRLKSCVTSANGKFCFRGLPSGAYELRISKDQGWDVTHVYIIVDRKSAKTAEPLTIIMELGK